MKKIYYLGNCTTCRDLMKKYDFSDFEKQEIRDIPISLRQLRELKKLSGDYKSLFSKRAKLYQEMGLKNENLTEKDFEHYLQEHYTFLQRPVIVDGNKIFIGSSPKTKKALAEHFS